MLKNTTDQYQEIRDAVRALCAEFPDEYHRKVDHERGYPVDFVDALTKAGWLADNQHIKPGNLMPSFDQWSGPDLRLAAHYLESLK